MVNHDLQQSLDIKEIVSDHVFDFRDALRDNQDIQVLMAQARQRGHIATKPIRISPEFKNQGSKGHICSNIR